jgi:Ca2+-binding RTX toxin-like protein
LDLDIVQATSGEIFIVPFTTGQEASQAILEQGPVQSISLTAVVNSGGDLNADRLASDFPDPVDGYDRDDTFVIGDSDYDGDTVDGADGDVDVVFGRGGNDTVLGGNGNDVIVGGAGDDDLSGGAGNDVIYGDRLDGTNYGKLDLQNTDNLQDGGGTNALDIRAVELIRLANGDLIMISSERDTADGGIRSYKIDSDPSSSTYGQILQTNNSIEASGGDDGYDDIDDMEAITTVGGNTYLYTADPTNQTIGVSQINDDGSLSRLTSFNVTNGTILDEVQELSTMSIGGQDFLFVLAGGSSDNLIAYEINANGSLTQRDLIDEDSGSNRKLSEQY